MTKTITAIRNMAGGTGSNGADLVTLGQNHIREILAHIDAQAAEIERLHREANKSERRAITFGDIVAQQVMAMRAAYVDAKLNGSDAGMAWIENTLDGPGHLPDLAAAKKEGGAQCMFNREMAEHEAFRAAHPAPGA